ncbi:MAG: immunoglobulin-like domain-containing protein [Bacteroidia bacterium]
MKKLLLSLALSTGFYSLMAQKNPYPVIPIDTTQFVSISKLQQTPPNDSPDYVAPMKNFVYRDTVRFEGIVLFDPRFYGLSTSRKATYLSADTVGRPWGGVMAMCEPVGSGVVAGPGQTTLQALIAQSKFYDNMKPGMKVRYTGVIRAFQNDNQVNVLAANPSWDNSIEILDFGPFKVRPVPIQVSEVQLGNANTGYNQQKVTGEKWEGVYVELRNVTVLTRSPNGASRWNWAVGDDQGNGLDIRDFSGFFRNDNLTDSVLPANRFTPPVTGTRISYVRGVITEYIIGGQPRYGISPLYPDDIGPVSYTPPSVVSTSRIPVMATASDSVLISTRIQQGSARVNQVRLFYSMGVNNNNFDSIILTRNTLPNDTMVWFGKIRPMPDGTVVRYRIRPIDINTESTTSQDAAYLVTANGVRSIKELRYSPFANYSSIWNGDSLFGIDVRGIVTSTNMTQGTINILTVQNGTDSFSAVVVNRFANDGTAAWRVGDSVSITSGRVIESFGITTLNNIRGTIISRGNQLPEPKKDLSIATIINLNSAVPTRPLLKPWEGFILNYDSVYVINKNADAPSDFGEFLVNTDRNATTGLRVDDISTNLPDLFNGNLTVGQLMKHLKGVFYLSFSNWKLQPRDSNDIDFSGAPDTEKPVLTLLGANPLDIDQNSTFVEPGFTATDNRDGDITSRVVVTGNVNTAVVGTYTLTYNVADNAGNTASATRTVRVNPVQSINENELVFAEINVFPNPAQSNVYVSARSFNTLPLNINIVDIAGRTIFEKTYYTKNVEDAINISNLNSGIYFVNFTNNKGSKAIKLVVSK